VSTSDIERRFVDACRNAGVSVTILRVAALEGNWQIDFTAGDRKFSTGNDSRDGFVFLERVEPNDHAFVLFDQGQATLLWIGDDEACKRAAEFLKRALANPEFRGCPSKVI